MKPFYLYGNNVVNAALSNPKRYCHQLFVTKDMAKKYHKYGNKLKIVNEQFFVQTFPGQLHQNIAGLFELLPQPSLEEISFKPEGNVVLLLDQVTDPQNIGTIFRLAAAFGCQAVITTKNNSPGESATICKVAAGGFEFVPYIRVGNLKTAIQYLKKHDFWVIGLDGNSSIPINKLPHYRNYVLVLGSEGHGIRHGVRENCDIIAQIPIENMESLNVSTAAAISIYQIKFLLSNFG